MNKTVAYLPTKRARTLAKLSAAIYEQPDEFSALARQIGFSVVDFVDHAGTQVAHVEGYEFGAIVFRGTQVASGGSFGERLRDFAFNLRQYPVEWSGPGRVHSGYLAALGRVRYAANRMVRKSSALKLYITGHSLGGALATLNAAEVAWHGVRKDHHLVTFGAPQAGTEAALACFGEPSLRASRYIIEGDPATIWPLSLTLEHPCPPIKLPAGGLFSRRHGVSKYVEALTPEAAANAAK
ncbi:MAG: lipase family protein [Pseudomonadota bacterium]